MAAQAYAQTTAELTALAGGVVAVAESALESTAAEIDVTIATAGYTTPVVVGDIADATQRERWTERLASLNLALAADEVTKGHTGDGRRGQPSYIRRGAEVARGWLERFSRGELVLPGLPVAAASAPFGATGLHVTRRDEDALSDLGDKHDTADASFAGI